MIVAAVIVAVLFYLVLRISSSILLAEAVCDGKWKFIKSPGLPLYAISIILELYFLFGLVILVIKVRT